MSEEPASSSLIPGDTNRSRYHPSLLHTTTPTIATSRSAPAAHLLSLLIPAYSNRAEPPLKPSSLDPRTPHHRHQPTRHAKAASLSNNTFTSACSSTTGSPRGTADSGPAVISLTADGCAGRARPATAHDSSPTHHTMSEQDPSSYSPFLHPQIHIAGDGQHTSVGRHPPTDEDLSSANSRDSCSSGTNMRLISRMYSAAANVLAVPVSLWLGSTASTNSSKLLSIASADTAALKSRAPSSSSSCPCTPVHPASRLQTPLPLPHPPANFFSLPFFYQQPPPPPCEPTPPSPSQSLTAAQPTPIPSTTGHNSCSHTPFGTSLDAIAESAPLFASSSQPFEKGYHGSLADVMACPQDMQRDVWRLADFNVRSLLYSGYMSHVFLASCKRTGRAVVLKQYRQSRLDVFHMHLVKREISIHSKLQHVNIIALFAVFQEGEDIVLVQECAEKGDLFQLLKQRAAVLSESQAQTVLLPLMSALQYLHSMGIVHRDLKPENVLVTEDGAFKLGDFGVSIDTTIERAVSRAGTLSYMPPEVLRCPPKANPMENKDRVELQYGFAADVWALGVLAFELLTGFPPFDAETPAELELHVENNKVVYPFKLSANGRSFLEGCLAKSATLRPSIPELSKHAWLAPTPYKRPTTDS
ncbi:MAG: hypothetical protein WDW38_001093 [Sanguina aurantia]